VVSRVCSGARGGAREEEVTLARVLRQRGRALELRACLAGAVLSDALRPGVVQLSTGAWYDPEDPAAFAARLKA